MRVRVPVPAGPHDVTAAFVEDMAVKDTVRLQPFLRSSADNFDWAGRPHIQTFAITGPFDADRPGRYAEPPRDLHAAGRRARRRRARLRRRRSSAALARRAYRQPVATTELAADPRVLRGGAHEGTFETRHPARARAHPRQPALRLPRRARSGARAPGARVSHLGSRARLAAVVLPLEQHPGRRAARRRRRAARCSEPAVLEQQVRRMLADPRVERARRRTSPASGCTCATCAACCPNSDEFPDFDDNLRQAFRRETELLFDSIMREDRSVLDLLRADYTFVNERLARHYGIPGSTAATSAACRSPTRRAAGCSATAACWR